MQSHDFGHPITVPNNLHFICLGLLFLLTNNLTRRKKALYKLSFEEFKKLNPKAPIKTTADDKLMPCFFFHRESKA